MLDLAIRNGTIVDGTGASPRQGDVGVRDGRVVAVGELDEPARGTLDARDLVVAPGIVDIHTHYDAQVFWDPSLTPSSLHGTTTVVGGNCGFSIAPLVPEAGDYLMRMLSKVEGMPLESLEQGVPWDWRSFGDYLDRIDGRTAINAGFLVGHTAIRRVVMGEAAVGERASEAQLGAMRRLLGRSLAEGGLGFSSSWAATHSDGDGQPVPSRHASREELVELCRVVRDYPGTTLEFIPFVGQFEESHWELMTAMSLAANRPLNWNVLAPNPQMPHVHQSQLAASDYASARGARVLALTLPYAMRVRINLRSGFLFDMLPDWGAVVALPLAERMRAIADPRVRESLRKGADAFDNVTLKRMMTPSNLYVIEAFTPETRALEGRRIGEIARERGQSDLDCLLDIALADELRTSFGPPEFGNDPESWRFRADLWKDGRCVIGASDSGAHLDMMDSFTYGVQVLGPGVRDRALLPLEEAVRLLTSVPADLYGIVDRGRIAEGAHADLLVFDPARIGPGVTGTRADLPAGAARLYGEPEGIEHVLVNGVEIAARGKLTGARPGTILRSGRDTRTVTVPGGE